MVHSGTRIQGTPFYVDYFRRDEKITHYFLTHCHADHMTGITPSWSYGVIWCSSKSKSILGEFYGEQLLERVQTIELNEKIEMYFLPESKEGDPTFFVTLLDANHCPGAVMFLFEGYWGQYLYTGDFKWRPGLVQDLGKIDRLYIDTTYHDPKYCTMWSLEETINEMVEIIKNAESITPWGTKEDRCEDFPDIGKLGVKFGVDRLGKEEVAVGVARKMGRKWLVEPQRYKRLKSYLPEVDLKFFTINPEESTLRCVKKADVATQRLSATWLTDPHIGIICTGWVKTYERQSESFNPNDTEITMVHRLPYSSHSSYNEILELVREVKPTRAIPITPTKSNRKHGELSSWDDELCHLLITNDERIVQIPKVISLVLDLGLSSVVHARRHGPVKKSVNSKRRTWLELDRRKNMSITEEALAREKRIKRRRLEAEKQGKNTPNAPINCLSLQSKIHSLSTMSKVPGNRKNVEIIDLTI